MGNDTVLAKVLYTIETTCIGHRLIFAVCAIGWVLYSQNIKKVVNKRVGRECIDPFSWNCNVGETSWALQSTFRILPVI